nr:hypothetical protein [Tanacetum cinerariifolium]
LPTTIDRWSGGGQRWSSGSQRWSGTGDRRRLPPLATDHHRCLPLLISGPSLLTGGLAALTGADLGGGWTNGRITRHPRYCSSSTRFSMRVQFKVQKVQKKKVSTRYSSCTRFKNRVFQKLTWHKVIGGSEILQRPMMRYEE